MINVKKGPAHSLGQADIRGAAGTGIYAGMLCFINSSGVVSVSTSNTGGIASATTGLRGFAINNSTDGDVLESGRQALYTLDGASIIETDQVDLTADSKTAISTTNYPIGTPMYASTGTAGLVSSTSTANGNIIGWVEGVRYLQNNTPSSLGPPITGAGTTSSQNYTSATEIAAYNAANAAGYTTLPTYTPTSKSASYKPQVNVAVLAIKLASSN